VISQSPSSGTLFRGDTVQLVVSKGPVMVEVPSVRGRSVEEATRRLEEAGFSVRTEKSNLYVDIGVVVDSDPKGGSKAPRGSTVTLYLV
jgi:beta-lactam-binding protein with PASTA domain